MDNPAPSSPPPRCSTAIDDLLAVADSSTMSLSPEASLGSASSLFEQPCNLQKAIDTLNLTSISPASSPWKRSDEAIVVDSDYRSLSSKCSDLAFGNSEEVSDDEEQRQQQLEQHEKLSGLDRPFSASLSPTDEDSLSAVDAHKVEPEAEYIEQFRRFGVRFIRRADRDVGCNCLVPHQLLEWSVLLREVAVESRDPLPLCFHYRWAEIKQDFRVDRFGDLQFQDFLLAREQRGPYHAMIHFASIFANVGYDGSYWYWVLLGDAETPFVESKHRRKANFVDSLRTMVREQFRLNRHAEFICPEAMPNAHLYVRGDETPFQREPDDSNCLPDIRVDEWTTSTSGHVDRPFEDSLADSEGPVRVINGQRAPRSLSYLQLYSDRFNSSLAEL